MKIALYYPWIYLKGGAERTILETIKRSKHDYTIFTNYYNKKTAYPEFAKLNVIELNKAPIRHNFVSAVYGAIVILLTQKINLGKFDMLIVHSEGFADLILFRNNRIPTICFCYTPLRPVFDDDNKRRVLNQKSFPAKIVYLIFSRLYSILDRYLWRKYKYIFFISRESLRRAKTGRLISSQSKYKILNPGVNWEKIKPTGKYDKYFFLPGRITWSKNLELAIEAFKIFSLSNKNKDSNFKLIIAGHVDSRSKKYLAKLKILSKSNKNIIFIIDPTDRQMHQLYSNCYGVLATAFNEDWGLTVIEANAYAKPALSINSGGFKESQLNNVTGFLLNNNPSEFANKMILLSNDKKMTERLGRQARNHSKIFSWKNFAAKYDKSINDVYHYSRK
jgi:glycosyltransferase involved in cell wall biosynthesis